MRAIVYKPTDAHVLPAAFSEAGVCHPPGGRGSEVERGAGRQTDEGPGWSSR